MENDESIIEISKKLIELHDQREELEGRVELIKEEYKALSGDFLQHAKNSGIDSMNIEGRNVHYSITPRAKIVNTEDCFKFFRDRGYDSIIKETIHAQTLTSTVKQLAEAGELNLACLDGTGLSVYSQELVRVTK